MQTDIQFSSYLAQFFLEWKMFRKNFLEEIQTHILCSITFFFFKFETFKSYLLSYLLTPWCRVLLEKLTGLQLVKKFPAFHGT